MPKGARGFLADDLQLDLKLLDESIAGAQDLIAAARWMMTRLSLADRHFLVGLCERMGGFEAGIAVANDLLAVAGTVEKAAWAMEHQSQLVCEEKKLEEIDGEVNVDAVLFLIDLDNRDVARQHCKDRPEANQVTLSLVGSED